jgi:hypothetical protein
MAFMLVLAFLAAHLLARVARKYYFLILVNVAIWLLILGLLRLMQMLLAILMWVTLLALTSVKVITIASIWGDLVLEIINELKLFADGISFFVLFSVQRALDLVDAVVYHPINEHAGLSRWVVLGFVL